MKTLLGADAHESQRKFNRLYLYGISAAMLWMAFSPS
jgi:hypothetical protein